MTVSGMTPDAAALAPDGGARRDLLGVASQWQLMWMQFRAHRLAMAGLFCTLGIYVIALFVEFIAPFDPVATERRSVFHPPQAIHLFHTDQNGETAFVGPFVYPSAFKRDPKTLKVTHMADTSRLVKLAFFAKGDPYDLWGVIPWDRHLLAPEDPNEHYYLFGADRLGRDMFSRVVYGTRVSMSIGLIGVTFSLIIGIFLGGISGYFGGRIDWVIMRVVELILSLPTIPIWLALAAALPADWPALWRYFMITLILSLVGWTELARVVRGRFLSLRTEDFVVSARLDGCPTGRVIFRHMLPSFASHIIAAVTLAVPIMILAETALSFLGLGLQPPSISWGVLLKEAQNIRSISQAPWLFIPGGAVVFAVLVLNFLGDGLRDAADPYAQRHD